MVHSVYFDLDALASSSSSDDELVDVKKCKDLSVTVLYKPKEYDTTAESKMSASDIVSQLESGAGDVRKVVRNRSESTDSQRGQPLRPRSRHELSAPTVDLVTGKCKLGKMIRTVSASPLTVDMTGAGFNATRGECGWTTSDRQRRDVSGGCQHEYGRCYAARSGGK